MGSPHLFRSDNSSNFVGAERELNLIQDGTFQGCSRMGGKKGAPVTQNLTLICYNDETSHSHTLLKKIYKT